MARTLPSFWRVDQVRSSPIASKLTLKQQVGEKTEDSDEDANQPRSSLQLVTATREVRPSILICTRT
jgi:hypothetical protein